MDNLFKFVVYEDRAQMRLAFSEMVPYSWSAKLEISEKPQMYQKKHHIEK